MNDRELYMMKCKYYDYEMCLKDTGYYGPGVHMTFGCDGNCRRMKNYDKKHQSEQR